MKKSSVIVSAESVQEFIEKAQGKNRAEFRFLFLDTFIVSHIVPVNLFNMFRKFAAFFYDKESDGYRGIMAEIDDRMEISKRTGRPMLVNDFLKHTDKDTDFYDPSINKAFEKKTGCGDWLVDKNATTLDKALQIYKRKRRLLRWDYDFVPETAEMNGKKSVNNKLSEEDKAIKQERSNPKKVGTQYPIHIHIETTYKRFFDYLSLYPSGIETFFKLSSRMKKDDDGTAYYVWQLQTIKNSKKKIAFLEHFNTWEETGLTIEEYSEQEGDAE